eukprot:5599722-Amphidinium_carterae.1
MAELRLGEPMVHIWCATTKFGADCTLAKRRENYHEACAAITTVIRVPPIFTTSSMLKEFLDQKNIGCIPGGSVRDTLQHMIQMTCYIIKKDSIRTCLLYTSPSPRDRG